MGNTYSSYNTDMSYVLDSQSPVASRKTAVTYEIMHMERTVATVTDKGIAKIIEPQFMPYDLHFEEDMDFDTVFNNRDVFQHWCASRVLSVDRKYAKEILNAIGAAQSVTDADRAAISRSYHCVSLTDVFWVREQGEAVSFEEINLYDHSLNDALVEVSLRGKALTVTNSELSDRDIAPDLSTKGVFPKAWIRTEDGFKLLKDGGVDIVRRESLASSIAQCFDFPQVCYRMSCYNGEPVTESSIITSKEYSIISKFAYGVYTCNHDLDVIEEAVSLDPVGYYGMNIIDYLVGNTDRHHENWGFWVENATNKVISLYPMMDFNQSFLAYDNIDGAMCLTTSKRMSQRQAAIQAVWAVGLRQVKEVDLSWFGNMVQERKMFLKRLDELRNSSNI